MWQAHHSPRRPSGASLRPVSPKAGRASSRPSRRPGRWKWKKSSTISAAKVASSATAAKLIASEIPRARRVAFSLGSTVETCSNELRSFQAVPNVPKAQQSRSGYGR